MRLPIADQKSAFSAINSRYDSDLKPCMGMYWFLGIVISIGIWLWYGTSNPVIRHWEIILVSMFYPILIVTPKIIMKRFDYEYFEENDFNCFKSNYAYMSVLLLIIGVLAAINSGLQ